jgi:hypothetical protein
VASAAVAAVVAAAVRSFTSSGKSGGQSPAATTTGGRPVNLSRLRLGPYSIDPPPEWKCDEPCTETKVQNGAFEARFVRGTQDGVSVLRYPLGPAQRNSSPKAVFRGAAADALHKVGFPASVSPAGTVGSLNGRRTWEYNASTARTTASGVTFVAGPYAYWVSGLGRPGDPVKSAVHDFAASLRP